LNKQVLNSKETFSLLSNSQKIIASINE